MNVTVAVFSVLKSDNLDNFKIYTEENMKQLKSNQKRIDKGSKSSLRLPNPALLVGATFGTISDPGSQLNRHRS